MDAAQVILVIASVYAAVGAVFAAAFAVRGAAAIDPSAYGAPVVFRLLILPGAAALWPLLLLKWRASRKERIP